MIRFAQQPEDILARLAEMRRMDAPTHGGHVLSYVYDTGLAELDELAAAAIRLVQPVNGLDPTTFPSVAMMEREVISFAAGMLGGSGATIVGTVTTGGTESCLLAVKTARDNWVAAGGVGTPRLLAPVTAHAAFRKAAHYFGLTMQTVAVDATTGGLRADDLVRQLGPDVALTVVSAPCYPYAALDPVTEVAAACLARGIDCHVDACIGGWVLPWWGGVADWDFRLEGVTSISADMHKFGYAPKGASVLLQRGRDRQRSQYFATTQWPGYPVVNPTMLGSKSAGALAASWAIIRALGADGFASFAASCRRSTTALIRAVHDIDGLRVVGTPVGPLLAVAADESVPAKRRVDPHHWADQVREHGWLLQLQPGLGPLPHTAHLTVTPVTEGVLDELTRALVLAADEVRGVPAVSGTELLAALPVDALAQFQDDAPLTSDAAYRLLIAVGLIAPGASDAALPERMAPFLALVEALPSPITQRLLIELLARLVEPA
ncbi:MAG: pyridoxal-dependent decarboxylase [Terrimesophilobacter sp.]